MRILGCLFLFLALFPTAIAQSRGTVFVVRHAEKQSDEQDTPLSPNGFARADCLAQTLKDANISAVLTSQYVRTKQTAAAVAREFNIEEKSFDAAQFAKFSDAAKTAAKTGNVLIVGHSNTISDLIQNLGGPGVTIPDTSYDQLFVVDVNHPQQMITLHYCPELPTDTTSHPAKSMAKP